MQYLIQVDKESLLTAEGRQMQDVMNEDMGVTNSRVMCIKTPPGGGSPEGLHAHEWDQLFFILSGTLMIEVEGEEPFAAGPETLVVYPKGVQHRNWNDTQEDAVHLSFNMSPLSA